MSRLEVARARAICSGCPVSTSCLEFALLHQDGWGVWGGYTANERKRAIMLLGTIEAVLRRHQEGTLAEKVIMLS